MKINSKASFQIRYTINFVNITFYCKIMTKIKFIETRRHLVIYSLKIRMPTSMKSEAFEEKNRKVNKERNEKVNIKKYR